MNELDRERLVKFGQRRAANGAGPVTLGQDIGAIKFFISHAAAVHGVEITAETVNLARRALKRLGLIGKGNEHDRRPTEEELVKLFAHFNDTTRQSIPMSRIIKFAIATVMRQEEICRVTWSDLNIHSKTLTIRNRKDPWGKVGNDQRIPLLAASGYHQAITLGLLVEGKNNKVGHRDDAEGASDCGFLGREHHKLRFTELDETFFARLILAKCPDPDATQPINGTAFVV